MFCVNQQVEPALPVEFQEGAVPGVGPCVAQRRPDVEGHPPELDASRFGGLEVLEGRHSVASPQAVLRSEIGDAGFGRDAGAGEADDTRRASGQCSAFLLLHVHVGAPLIKNAVDHGPAPHVKTAVPGALALLGGLVQPEEHSAARRPRCWYSAAEASNRYRPFPALDPGDAGNETRGAAEPRTTEYTT